MAGKDTCSIDKDALKELLKDYKAPDFTISSDTADLLLGEPGQVICGVDGQNALIAQESETDNRAIVLVGGDDDDSLVNEGANTVMISNDGYDAHDVVNGGSGNATIMVNFDAMQDYVQILGISQEDACSVKKYAPTLDGQLEELFDEYGVLIDFKEGTREQLQEFIDAGEIEGLQVFYHDEEGNVIDPDAPPPACHGGPDVPKKAAFKG